MDLTEYNQTKGLKMEKCIGMHLNKQNQLSLQFLDKQAF